MNKDALEKALITILESKITHILHYHDKEGGRTSEEQVIFKNRFPETADAILKWHNSKLQEAVREERKACADIAGNHKCSWGSGCLDETCEGGTVLTGDCGEVIAKTIESRKP
jgi:hypothetical protein